MLLKYRVQAFKIFVVEVFWFPTFLILVSFVVVKYN